jgi:cold shock protein
MARGTVKFVKTDRGYGAIASLPIFGTAWTRGFISAPSRWTATGFLEAGERVEFGYEAAQHDSFRFVATWVRRL